MSKGKTESVPKALTFEKALSRLQDIVSELEDPEKGLEESLVLFEEGVRLSRELQASLQAASLRVTQLLDGDPPRETFRRGERQRLRTNRQGEVFMYEKGSARHLLVAGKWIGDTSSMQVIDKHSGDIIATVPVASPETVDKAVAAALEAFPAYSKMPAHVRSRILEKTAYLEFRLVHKDNDKLVAESLSDPAFVPPPGYVQMSERARGRDDKRLDRICFVKVKPEMTGKYVDRAYWQPDELGRRPRQAEGPPSRPGGSATGPSHRRFRLPTP